MRLRTGCMLLGLLLSAMSSTSGELVRLGPLGGRLSSDDLVAIEKAVSPDGSPWAVLAWRELVSDPHSLLGADVWYVDVFLEPSNISERLRRGAVIRLRCWPLPEHTSCLYWRQKETSTYAQVADKERFTQSLAPRSAREEPIRVNGRFSDDDLETLVAYLRSGPRPRSRSVRWQRIDWSLSISDVSREDDGKVYAWVLQPDGLVAFVSLVRTQAGWQATDAAIGIP